MPSLTCRGLTLLMSALAVAGQAAFAFALAGGGTAVGVPGLGTLHPALVSTAALSALVSLASAALAVVMATRRDPGPGARPMGLALAAWAYVLAYPGVVLLLSPGADSSLHGIFDSHFLLVEAVGLAALIRFTALFPSPLEAEALRDPRTLPPGLGILQRFRRWLLRPSAPWIAGVAAALACTALNAALGRPAQDAALLPLADALRLGALTVVVLNLRRSWLGSGGIGRTRTTWVVLGFAVLAGTVGVVLGGNVLSAVTGWEVPGVNWRSVVLHLGVMGLLWGSAMGILYSGDADPAPLVRGVAVLATAGTLALFLAAGLESLLSSGGPTHFSLPRGSGTLLAALTMALVYGRTRRPLEGLLRQGAPAEPDPPMGAGR